MHKISSDTRGHIRFSWLDTHHSFSFGNYYDPNRMGFRALRVLNEDTIAPGKGFGTHPHEDMEIVTIPLSGSLAHRDSTGGEGVVESGDIQIMSAGTGIEHSEYNASNTQECHLLQLWIIPHTRGLQPRYDQKRFEYESNALTVLVSPEGKNDSLHIFQNTWFSLGNLDQGKELTYTPYREKTGVYLFCIEGEVSIGGETLRNGDALQFEISQEITITASKNAQFLIIETV